MGFNHNPIGKSGGAGENYFLAQYSILDFNLHLKFLSGTLVVLELKGVNSETIKMVPLPEGFPVRSNANLYKVITTSLQRGLSVKL